MDLAQNIGGSSTASSEAREKRDEARKKLANNIDSGVAKQIFKEAERAITENSFETVAREWFAKAWVNSHRGKILGRLQRCGIEVLL